MSTTKKATAFGWFVCLLGALFYCYEYVLRIMPSVMTSELRHAFNINATMLGNLAAFYYYAYTPMQIPVGVLMDRYGPRRLLILAVLVCGIGTVLFNSPNSLCIASFGRFLIGFGSAFGFVGVLKLATVWLPSRFFAFISGLATTLGMLGGMFGSIYLEHLVYLVGWEGVLRYGTLAAFCLAILFIITMPSHRALEKEEGHSVSFGQLFEGLWHLMKNPVIWLNGLVGCLLYLSLSVFAELWGPKYLETAHNLTSSQSVTASSTIFLAWAIGGPLVGLLATNYRRSLRFLLIGSIISFITSTILVTQSGLTYWEIRLVLFIFGLGSVSQILIFNIARISAGFASAATSLAFANMLVMAGGMIFEPLVGKLLDMFWSGQTSDHGHRIYAAADFNHAIMVIPLGCLLCCFLVLIMRRFHARYEDIR